MTSHHTPANQPYSVHLHRNGRVEIVYDQPSKGSHASAPRHTTPSSSPRSTAATFGSSHTRIASSTMRRESPPTTSSTKHHVSESSSHQHHHRSSDPHRSSSAHTGHHHSSSGERHRHNSTSRLDKPSLPIPILGQSHSHSRSRSHSNTPSPQGSPKQTRFASLAVVHAPIVTSSGHLAPPLSHSYQAQAPLTAVPSRSPKRSSSTLAVPASRHKPSSSADSFFFLHRPKGWYNRRGDRFVQKGVVEYQAKHLEWHPTFGGYPPPGEGWMDENGHFMPMGGGILKN
jgi:hypothetical protein